MACRGRSLPSHRYNLHTCTMTISSSTCNNNEPIHSHTHTALHYTESVLTVLLCRRCGPRWPVRGIVGEFPSLRERAPSSPPTRRRGLRERWEMEVRGREEWDKRKMRSDGVKSKPLSKSKPSWTKTIPWPKEMLLGTLFSAWLEIIKYHFLIYLLNYITK